MDAERILATYPLDLRHRVGILLKDLRELNFCDALLESIKVDCFNQISMTDIDEADSESRKLLIQTAAAARFIEQLRDSLTLAEATSEEIE